MSTIRKKPSVAIVADTPEWAYANISCSIQKYTSCEFLIDIIYTNEFSKDNDLYLTLFLEKSYDLVHFLFRKNILSGGLFHPFQQRVDKDIFEQYSKGLENTVITASVYDHLFLNDTDINRYRFFFQNVLNGYTVSSDKLFKIYINIPGYPAPDAVIEDGVDLEKFYPNVSNRYCNNSLIVGWVGNSRWGMEDGTDHKGYKTIIAPAVDNLIKAGYQIELNIADRNVKLIPHSKMVKYYQSIDVLVCASDIEGTPNPVLEAMACGIPVISTDVGIVPRVFGSLQKQYILPERTIECLETKLKELLEQPDKRRKLAQENLSQIKCWTREQEALKWKTFFLSHIKQSQSNEFNRAYMLKQKRRCLIDYQAVMGKTTGEFVKIVKNRPTYIWGAGQGGFKTLQHLKEYDINIDGFLDNDPNKAGTSFHDKPIFSPEYINRYAEQEIRPFIFIGSSHLHSIKMALEHLGLEENSDFFDCSFVL